MAKKLGNLSSLQFALSEILDEPQQADEFTTDQFFASAREQDPSMTINTARCRLVALHNKGLLEKRHVRRNGKVTNLYRKA